MKIYSIDDKEFEKFGKKVECPVSLEFDKQLDGIEDVNEGTKYLPSVESLEFEMAKQYFTEYFGETEIQIGLCYGKNNALNALEWHKSSEINYASKDMILLLGDIRDVKDNTYNSKKVMAFEVKKGECVEIYSTTLHFCPIALNNKTFKTIVILPKGTNTNLDKNYKDKTLIRKNKWLICHKDAKNLVDSGRVIGIIGENIVL